MSDLPTRAMRYFTDATYRIGADALLTELAATAPVLKTGPFWLVSGYDEVSQLCRASETSSNSESVGVPMAYADAPTLASAMSLMLPMRDGEDHRRLKRMANGAFNVR